MATVGEAFKIFINNKDDNIYKLQRIKIERWKAKVKALFFQIFPYIIILW